MKSTENRNAEMEIRKIFLERGFSEDEFIRIMNTWEHMQVRELLYMQHILAGLIDQKLGY